MGGMGESAGCEMTTTTNPEPTETRCFGVCCPKHQSCEGYYAVNGSSPDHTKRGTCKDSTGAYPLFVLREVVA